MAAPSDVRRQRNIGTGLLFAAAPWAWFLGRDALGVVTDVLAIVLPLLVVLGVSADGVRELDALLALLRPSL